MKNIELTEDHKSKLLEMCKKLFPEYTEIYLGINDYDDNFDGFIYFQKTIPLISNIIESVHWFEFCMTHLCEKIFVDDESLNDYLLTFNVDKHLIDYLYEEFKN